MDMEANIDLEEGEIEDEEENDDTETESKIEESNQDATEDETKEKSRSKSRRDSRSSPKHLLSDEDKRRRLKEKLYALEMQMAAEDEAMGVFGSERRSYGGELSDESNDSSPSRSPDRKRRRHREHREKRKRNEERYPRDRKRRDRDKTTICQLFMQGKCPKVNRPRFPAYLGAALRLMLRKNLLRSGAF